jgi:hypothetical protein
LVTVGLPSTASDRSFGSERDHDLVEVVRGSGSSWKSGAAVVLNATARGPSASTLICRPRPRGGHARRARVLRLELDEDRVDGRRADVSARGWWRACWTAVSFTTTLSWVLPSGSVKRAFESWSETEHASGCECIGLFAPARYADLEHAHGRVVDQHLVVSPIDLHNVLGGPP